MKKEIIDIAYELYRSHEINTKMNPAIHVRDNFENSFWYEQYINMAKKEYRRRKLNIIFNKSNT